MITVEELIVQSIYHKLVLVNVKRTPTTTPTGGKIDALGMLRRRAGDSTHMQTLRVEKRGRFLGRGQQALKTRECRIQQPGKQQVNKHNSLAIAMVEAAVINHLMSRVVL